MSDTFSSKAASVQTCMVFFLMSSTLDSFKAIKQSLWCEECRMYRRIRNLRGISKHYICGNLEHSWLYNDVIVWVSEKQESIDAWICTADGLTWTWHNKGGASIDLKKKTFTPFAAHVQQEYIKSGLFLLHSGQYILYTQAVLWRVGGWSIDGNHETVAKILITMTGKV